MNPILQQSAGERRREAVRIVNLLRGVEYTFSPRARAFLLAMRAASFITPRQLDFLRSLREEYLSD